MDRETARQIAEARECGLVGFRWGRRASWLMPPRRSTLDRLMECIATGQWLVWSKGQHCVLDGQGNELSPEQTYDWDQVAQPLVAVRRKRA